MTTWGSWTKTGLTMDQGWTGTLSLNAIIAGNYCGASAQVSGMGCTAVVDRYILESIVGNPFAVPADWYVDYSAEVTDVAEAYIDALNIETADEQLLQPLVCDVAMYRYQLTTPGGVGVLYQCTGRWRFTMPPTSPWQQFGPTDMTATYNFALQDVLLKVRGGDSTPATRQLRDFIDQHIEYAWHGEAGATNSGGTLATPVGTLSSSGSWGSHPGEGPLGSHWGTTCELDYEMTANTASSTTGVSYVTIGVQWQGVDLSLDKLHDCYTGSWEHWYSGLSPQSPWPPAGAEWQVLGGGGEMNLSRIAASAYDPVWTGYSYVPYAVKYAITSNRWDDSGGW